MAVLGLGGAAVWLVVFSSVLTVDDVRVSGADGELADIVRDTAQVPMGEKLIRVDTAEIAERVRGIGELDDASVSRSWPSAVTIRVSPREPLAVVADDESWWRIDAEGVLFGATSERPDDLPAIDVTVEPDRDAERAEGVAVATTLPGAVAEIVELVTVESRADVRLELAGGPMVLWGTAERTADKAAVLLALIDEYAANDDDSPPKVYDVSAPDRPAVTP
jgi:cell division protein FtsQ